jgi:hypothetical protein
VFVFGGWGGNVGVRVWLGGGMGDGQVAEGKNQPHVCRWVGVWVGVWVCVCVLGGGVMGRVLWAKQAV